MKSLSITLFFAVCWTHAPVHAQTLASLSELSGKKAPAVAQPEPAAEAAEPDGDEDDDPGHGLATEAIDSVTKVSDEEDSPELEAFSKDYIGVIESSSGLGLYRGKYLKPLDIEDFLRTVGEDDLADEQSSNEILDTSLMIGGHVTFWGGLTALIISGGDGELVYIGLGGMGVGVALWIARSFVDDQVIDPPQARELADRYNVALRKKNNLSAEEAREAVERVEAAFEKKALLRDVQLVPMMEPNGARLMVIGAF